MDSFDFSRASRKDVKKLARTMINSITIMLFGYVTAGFAIFCGLFLCALRKVENIASSHFECVQILRPTSSLYNAQPRFNQDFERLPNTDMLDENQYPQVHSPHINGIPQRIVIPRGVVIN